METKFRIISKYSAVEDKFFYYIQEKKHWWIFNFWCYVNESSKDHLSQYYFKLHGFKKAFDNIAIAKREIKYCLDLLAQKKKEKEYGEKIECYDIDFIEEN